MNYKLLKMKIYFVFFICVSNWNSQLDRMCFRKRYLLFTTNNFVLINTSYLRRIYIWCNYENEPTLCLNDAHDSNATIIGMQSSQCNSIKVITIAFENYAKRNQNVIKYNTILFLFTIFIKYNRGWNLCPGGSTK